jgi:molecular chaperone DnaK
VGQLPRYIGIDLGTTNSLAAYLERGGRAVTLRNRNGQLMTPSVVYIKADGSAVAGKEALSAAREWPDRVAMQFKRDMGDPNYRRPVGGQSYTPQWLSAVVLRRIAEDAAGQLGPVGGAVITVPAYFGDARRSATIDAGRIAGLNVVDIINEPTAAALAGAYRKYIEKGGDPGDISQAAISATAPSTVLVYDLGGGTFDVSIIRIDGAQFDVLATGGEVWLGGVDWDQRIVDYAANAFTRRYGVDPRDHAQSQEKLRAVSEAAKQALTKHGQVEMAVEHLGKRLVVPLTQARFEEMTTDLLTRSELSTELVLKEASLIWEDIDEVMLVGGASRMPMVQKMVRRISGQQPMFAVQPDEIVTHGAAIHAAIMQMHDGAARKGPKERLFVSAGEAEEETNVLASLFDDSVREMSQGLTVRNVNSHTLGVVARDIRNGSLVNSKLVPKNTTLPARMSKVFGTEKENQNMVRVRVIEGEASEATACTQVGECIIAPLPEGLPQGSPIEVTFAYYQDGRLHVTASDLTSGTLAEAHIERSGELADRQIEAMSEELSGLVLE